MKYNFDEIVDRHHTEALKIEALKSRWGREDLIPLWVADMDFKTPPFIMEMIRKRCEHEILGYTVKPDEYYKAICIWLKKRYNWDISTHWISFCSGIVPGITFAIQSLTQPGDKILIQPPVYHPFKWIIEQNNRTAVCNPLLLENGQYKMNIDHFRKAVKNCKLFILCNPHNPGGRVWSKEELKIIADICYENKTIVISDEIHADLTLPSYKHTPFAKVCEKAQTNSVIFMAPSKAFNTAGLSSSYCIIENENIRQKFRRYIEGGELGEGHLFAYIPVVSAYNEQGEEWLNQVLEYIYSNVEFIDNYLQKNMPHIKAIRPQASFLIFLDCRELHLSQDKLVDFFVDKAHLALNDGSMFGKEGIGFMRLNIGCPKKTLEQAMSQLKTAYDNLHNV